MKWLLLIFLMGCGNLPKKAGPPYYTKCKDDTRKGIWKCEVCYYDSTLNRNKITCPKDVVFDKVDRINSHISEVMDRRK